jgi:parvulin-like peptidyl-prolyl isomerase
MPPNRLAALAAAIAVLSGCSSGQPRPKPLSPEAFMGPRTEAAAGTGSGGSAAGETARPTVQIPLNASSTGNGAETSSSAAVPPRTSVDALAPAPSAPSTPATTSGSRPTSLPTIGASSGEYMTLGGVVAEVNSTPIYANKVLSVLDPILREKAKRLDVNNFRREAAVDINRRIQELIRLELLYAAAQRTLDKQDKKLADLLTMQWRMQQITRAGGSVELARRRAREEFGMDFDEMAQEQSHNELLKIYDQKKVIPRIQVSAGDIREYYDKHVNDIFSSAERVKFRLLKVDIKKSGDKDKAVARIDQLYKRAKGGEDFAAMSQKENDQTLFASKDALDMNPASFSIAAVRDALAKLQPGQVSEPIQDASGFYLVKLEERTPGQVRPFEEQKVQDEIRLKLRLEQYGRLREQDLGRLMKGSIIRPDPDVLTGRKPATPTELQMLNVALDMAMQKYPAYASAK